MMKRILIPALLLSTSLAMAGGIYSWKDKDGNVHFGDRPPAEAPVQEVEVQANTVATPDYVKDNARRYVEDLETHQPSRRVKRRKVIMYSAAWCGVCKRARRYFQQKHIPFTEYDIDTSEEGRKGYARYRTRAVPVIAVGKKHMTGFSPAGFQRLYGSVD